MGTVDAIICCRWWILYVQQIPEKFRVYCWLRRSSFVPVVDPRKDVLSLHPHPEKTFRSFSRLQRIFSQYLIQETFRIHSWLQRRSLYLHSNPEETFYAHNRQHRRFFMSLLPETLLNYISLQRRISLMRLTPEESVTKKRNVTFSISIIIIVVLPSGIYSIPTPYNYDFISNFGISIWFISLI
jgi:hypothetical protein